MYWIEDVLVSDGVLEARFACQIHQCKGACCWEGDFGAPLEPEEVNTLLQIRESLRPWLSPAGNDAIDTQGAYIDYPDMDQPGTPLIDGGPCAYLVFDRHGIAKCGIEQAWNAGVSTFRKPISCHLYPIRIIRDEVAGFTGLNYHEWDICNTACEAGRKNNISLVHFLKDALVRKFGENFWEALADAADQHLHQSKIL